MTANVRIPTEADITAKAQQLAKDLGGGVGLQIPDVMYSLDCAFPGMSGEQFSDLRNQVTPIVGKIRADALAKMWGAAA